MITIYYIIIFYFIQVKNNLLQNTNTILTYYQNLDTNETIKAISTHVIQVYFT